MCHKVEAYRPGDVVLFSRNGRLFVHRVVEMSGGAVVTRGDSMLNADPPVAVSDVLGLVESIERGGSRVAMAERVSGARRAAGAALGQSVGGEDGLPAGAGNLEPRRISQNPLYPLVRPAHLSL